MEGQGARRRVAGEEALKLVQAGDQFDVVLLDLFMPGMDGVALAEAIRKPGPKMVPKLVLVSSAAMREHGASVDALLAKPVKPRALYDALVTVLAGAEPRFKLERAPETPSDPELAKRHPLKILLAEDNAVNQKLALRLLANMGYIPDVVGDGLQALRAGRLRPRRRADGYPDARARRPGGDPPNSQAVARSRAAHRRHDRQRHGRRPRRVYRRRHERLREQTNSPGRARGCAE